MESGRKWIRPLSASLLHSHYLQDKYKTRHPSEKIKKKKQNSLTWHRGEKQPACWRVPSNHVNILCIFLKAFRSFSASQTPWTNPAVLGPQEDDYKLAAAYLSIKIVFSLIMICASQLKLKHESSSRSHLDKNILIIHYWLSKPQKPRGFLQSYMQARHIPLIITAQGIYVEQLSGNLVLEFQWTVLDMLYI